MVPYVRNTNALVMTGHRSKPTIVQSAQQQDSFSSVKEFYRALEKNIRPSNQVQKSIQRIKNQFDQYVINERPQIISLDPHKRSHLNSDAAPMIINILRQIHHSRTNPHHIGGSRIWLSA